MARTPPASSYDLAVLGLILALALALRVIGLDAPLWFDEILTMETHVSLPWSDFVNSYSMNHHYLHNLEVKLATEALGEANWVVRLPAMIFGVGAIAAAWFLARPIGGPNAAHLTALLLAVSYHHIWFSQNARGYTELAFWGTVGMSLFLHAVKAPRPRLWIGYGIVLAAATYTHLTGAFLFAAQGLLLLAMLLWQAVRGRAGGADFLWPVVGYGLGLALSALLYLPVLPGLLETVTAVSETSAVDVMHEYQTPLWSIAEALRTGLGAAGPVTVLAGLMLSALLLLGAAASRRPAPLFAPAVGLHVALSVLLLVGLGMRVWPRFFFVDSAFFVLLAVLGVQSLCRWVGQKLPGGGTWVMPVTAAVLVAASTALALRNYLGPKQDLAGAVRLVAAERLPGERVFTFGPGGQIFNGYFGTDWTMLAPSDDYAAAMATGPALMVVVFPGRVFRAFPAFSAEEESGRLSQLGAFKGTLGDGTVLVYRRHADG
ncbi:hypothetical protein AYJ57_13265 [Salipiger sp. CCB-MM3]|uniref:glycosyltransferase family 39 protein n=1 Tax=Salipiger sp. CCB-MM3 TaxID=1792508 RepID=UPI00080AA164|nr:glycosyltransferase family 39 protein [Salipiger sp. CCB-MM3]ANT61255.1 hypothetical protein AYJ57_13265 [Salipiger sp. CCB-MM3]